MNKYSAKEQIKNEDKIAKNYNQYIQLKGEKEKK